MLLLLQIGNVRHNRFPHQDGTNREMYQVQILGASLVNNPMYGVLSNNQQDGMRKTQLNNNRPQGGTLKIQCRHNKHRVGDKCQLNNKPLGGARKTQRLNSLLPGIPRHLLSNNLPHGMRKTQLNSNRPLGGLHQARLLNSLLDGTRRVHQVQEASNSGTHPLLHLMHGLSLSRVLRHGVSKVTNLQHQQRMEIVAVQVSRGHNQLK
jgi:hypothetical protein